MSNSENIKPCVRIDLFFSQAVEDDFMIEFKEKNIAQRYTKVIGVQGNGVKNPKMGDSIWPQLNNMMTIFCSEAEAEQIIRAVHDMRKRYPIEGIGCFKSQAEEII